MKADNSSESAGAADEADHTHVNADVVVVGGGLSGLYAARELMRKGVSVELVEASDRVGGRIVGVEVGQTRFDMGAQFIGPTQVRVAGLVRELGLETFPNHTLGRKLLDSRGKLRSHKSDLPSLPLLPRMELRLVMYRLDKMAERIQPAAPMHSPAAPSLDRRSVAEWKRTNVRSRRVRGLIDTAVRTVLGAEPEEVSLLHFLTFWQAGEGRQIFLSEGGAQQDRVVQGCFSIPKLLAAELDSRIHLDAPVHRVGQHQGLVSVQHARGTITARRAIFAMPPHMASRISFEPGLPPSRDQLMQRWPMGATIKVIATYERPFWREDGFSGEAVSDQGPITVVMDNTSYDGVPALVGMVVGKNAQQWARRGEEARRRLALAQFARLFGDPARRPSAYQEHNWLSEAFVRGGPIANPQIGTWTTQGRALRKPVGRIHWAGTETAGAWIGFMEGAIESAERVVMEVLGALAEDR